MVYAMTNALMPPKCARKDVPYRFIDILTTNLTTAPMPLHSTPRATSAVTLVWNKAALANYTLSDNNSKSTSNSNSSSSDSASNSNGTLNNKNENSKDNNDVAIGAGVGVPLGVLPLTALGWALYERKKRHSLQALVAGIHSQAAVTKLNTQGNTPIYTPLRELPDTQKPPQELPTSESRV
ncbi:hypothetical protein N7499_011704 [Penicillium canescens]|uniref:Uncharacterized protein n=1 Tax=Penicillium canescens TaxID=5083 RepID=A0AAD6IKP6_PENCN|nr:uncharacterized protein N7446_006965 [Penicillium canescens]KAJ6049707.1 hypothetical protein N7444_006423 [Penicillium canescens]KAJ6052323.1 hypothetical protein N7460_002857 [Penicillium canescens]KAJ6062845.1 hypothetical protein N7446_006965 [Penicillium canescens]KAJ6069817.1 hypothetical protein N7499_011704 [Penicillium canescens]KAJ6182132.1 hypothetical protein N7485_000774 [Penicillium canescens]